MAEEAGSEKRAGKKAGAERSPKPAAANEAKTNGNGNGQPDNAAGAQGAGMPIFYSQPEVLDSERHAGLELKPVKSYEFTRSVNAIPITAAEFPAVARDYPIVFTTGENPGAIAIVGLRRDENLMLDKKGSWLKGTYVPAYVRRYPFIFLRSSEGDQFALCIDRASKQVVKGSKAPLFEGKELGEVTKNALEFCKAFQQQHMATEKVAEILREHDLLSQNQGRFNLPDGRSVAITDFMTVDEKKFNALSDEAFIAIRKSGALPPIYCHLISMGSWQRLVERFAVLFPKA
ncbi:MAG: SapC family protein [Pseudomonadota bacterium]